MLSGFWRGDALAAADALERLEDGLACRRRGARAAPGPRRRPRRSPSRRCSVETYSSPSRRGLVLGAARSTRLARGSSDSEPPWILARRAEDRRPARRGTRAGRRRAGGGSRPGRRRPARRARDRMCSASRTGLSSSLGGRLGGDDGLLGLLGEAIELHVGSLLGCGGQRCEGLAGRRGRGSVWRRPLGLVGSRSVGRTTRTLT